jgi:type VI protein secretion system component VasK
MKPEDQANPKRGLSYEFLLFVTISEPFGLIAIHFLISRVNTTMARLVTISSVVSVALLWVWWFRQQRLQKAAQLELEISNLDS